MVTKIVHKIICLFLAFCILNCSMAMASNVMPRADTEFMSTSLLLKSTKQVTFRATTYEEKDKISVTACWLEKENADGSWTTVCSLPAPSAYASESISFSTTVNYSSYIGTGNFRIQATFNADGHTLTVTSNERSF